MKRINRFFPIRCRITSSNVLLFLILSFFLSLCFNLPAWAASYLAAVAQPSTLKIARINDLGGTPTTEQVEIDLSADFYKVDDVTFLASPDCCGPRIAVLGNTFNFVPYEYDIGSLRGWGDSHRLDGKIAIYAITPSGPLGGSLVRMDTYSHWFDTEWNTRCTDPDDTDCYRGPISPVESYHIAGLPSGGIAVEAHGIRMATTGFDGGGVYNKFILFDNDWQFRFMSDGPLSYWYSYGPADSLFYIGRDLAGLSNSDEDRFVWTAKNYGYTHRYRVDWEANNLILESRLDNRWCANPGQMSSLADIPDYIIGGGFALNCYGRVGNVIPEFNNDQLFLWDWGSHFLQWGGTPPQADEVLGLSSSDDKLYTMIRHYQEKANPALPAYHLYQISKSIGNIDNYIDKSFSFEWDNNTFYRSDGDAILTHSIQEDAFTTAQLSGIASTQTSLEETLSSSTRTLQNGAVSGELSGTFNFTKFEMIEIQTGAFAGKGFSKGKWEAALEGAPYRGDWKGMFFRKASEGKIYLKGAFSGELSGMVEGELTETTPGSGVYDKYNAVWTLIENNNELLSGSINLEGTLTASGSPTTNPSTPISVLQASLSGTAAGHLPGALSVNITRLQINSQSNPYNGEGFSIISFIASNGTGSGWAYNRKTSDGRVDLKGVFSSPVPGFFCGSFNELSSPKSMLLTVNRSDFGFPPMADLEVMAWGPHNVSPGQIFDLIVEYNNYGVDLSENTVIVLSLPQEVDYVSSTEAGAYSPEWHKVIWKIGTSYPKTKGTVSTKVKVKFGLPGHLKFYSNVRIGTTSAEIDCILDPDLNISNIDRYLGYRSADVLSVTHLSPTELNSELTEPQFQDLYAYALELGYQNSGMTFKTTFNNGLTVIDSYMVQPPSAAAIKTFSADNMSDDWPPSDQRGFLRKIKNTSGETIEVILITIEPNGIARYQDRNGYMWAVQAADDPPVFQGWEESRCPRWNLFKKCMADKGIFSNVESLVKEIINNLIGKVALLGTVYNATGNCALCLYSNGIDDSACLGCLEACDDLVEDVFPPATFDMLDCIDKIKKNPQDYECTYCTHESFCWKGVTEAWDSVRYRHCAEDCSWKEADEYAPGTPGYKPLERCHQGCLQVSNNEAKCKDNVKNYSSHENENIVAKDPNFKYGSEGFILAGQRLTYKIEFENEGQGIAFGVYFTDILDEDLDASSIVIGPVYDKNNTQISGAGIYNPANRTITWFAGEVGPSEGGYAEFSVKVPDDAPLGTEVINYGTVYFPSVPEETRTNGIVSYIPYTISAYAGLGGVISPSGNVLVAPNGDQKFTITPDAGYRIAEVRIDNVPVSNASFHTFWGVKANHSISVSFETMDGDGDGIPDDWELTYGLNPDDPSDAGLDTDGDGLTNLQEYLNKTNPQNSDTDGDGMPDGWEVTHGLNPLVDDATDDKDGDGYTNLQEYLGISDPSDPNSIPKQQNQPPVADAGDDQNVKTGVLVTLDGSDSYDPDGDFITYDWSMDWDITAKPKDSQLSDADIVDIDSAKPSFTPDVDGLYEFRLVVNDGEDSSEPDYVEVFASTSNVPPNADANAIPNAFVGDPVTLDGSASIDPDNGPESLSYHWTFLELPSGSSLINDDITDSDQELASFTPDAEGVYVLLLTVSDGESNDDDEATINVSVRNVPPNADAGQDLSIKLGQVAYLDGSSSSDPDNGPKPLTYAWRFVSVAPGSGLTNDDIFSAVTDSPSFTPDIAGDYVLELQVSDGLNESSDNVTVTVTDVDQDGDGIPDENDECINSNLEKMVSISGCLPDVINHILPNGCSINDLILDCASQAKNHEQFVSCVANLTNDIKKEGIIKGKEKGKIEKCAAQADIP